MPTAPEFAGSPIQGEGFELVLIPLHLLRAAADGSWPTVDWLGLPRPSDWLVETMPCRRRIAQIEQDPSVAPWLLRLIVVPDDRPDAGRPPGQRAGGKCIAGNLGGHDAPDERGMVEIGYSLDPRFRGQGLATRAAATWFEWARGLGAGIARLQIEPANAPSLAIARRLGLVAVDEVWDVDDQVWERVLEAPLPLADPPRR